MFLFRDRLQLFILMLLIQDSSLQPPPIIGKDAKLLCESCGLGEYDDCQSSNPVVECSEVFSCFKTYNTSVNRLQKGCSSFRSASIEYLCIQKLISPSGSLKDCYDLTKTNLALIEECKLYVSPANVYVSSFNGSFEVLSVSGKASADVKNMTTRVCFCELNKTGACNIGDVPGFEEIQRTKIQVNQCYTCGVDVLDSSCKTIIKGETDTTWCRSKFCYIRKKKYSTGTYNILTGQPIFDEYVQRHCADNYENPDIAFKCAKKGAGGCRDIKKLQNCSAVKSNWKPLWMSDYIEHRNEALTECICEGPLCNDRDIDKISYENNVDIVHRFNNVIIFTIILHSIDL